MILDGEYDIKGMCYMNDDDVLFVDEDDELE